MQINTIRQPYVSGFVNSGNILIPKIFTTLSLKDRFSGFMVRLGYRRMHYTVRQGLYAVGNPDKNSPVIVTANYKLTFDVVRNAISGMNLWMLVLNTHGVNVWCAAGKGTFGTGEIARMVKMTKLATIVSHRNLIVPQLGAPGVSAHRVKKLTDFSVTYGPVKISDLKKFIDNGNVADKSMRTVEFSLIERMKVAPLELVLGWKILIGLLILSLLNISSFIPLVGSVITGIFLFPALLPYLPFRSFTLKGAILGLVWACFCSLFIATDIFTVLEFLLIIPPVVAYMAFNFTGSTTFTSPSGVRYEIKKYTWPFALWMSAGIIMYFVNVFRGLL
ncbi:MAG TPA: mercury methylation corrinoid protein HgcA [bacterium]|nr:mercury methylation corrinoid protein HgcA [bacterium]HQN73010.1 mercury methylation corrinoid protein HgcA [bacterium]HQO92718.1 mercury methylation corrinoid protein HgcA [bacterium]